MLLDWFMYSTWSCVNKRSAFSAFSSAEDIRLFISYCSFCLFFFTSSIFSRLAFSSFSSAVLHFLSYVLPNRLCTSIVLTLQQRVTVYFSHLLCQWHQHTAHNYRQCVWQQRTSWTFYSSVCQLTENPLSTVVWPWVITSSIWTTSHSLPYGFFPAIVENRKESYRFSDRSKSLNADNYVTWFFIIKLRAGSDRNDSVGSPHVVTVIYNIEKCSKDDGHFQEISRIF